ncbi:phenylalanine--tRNA ligase subunit alpha [Candidatus Babeliales bacterium]|nr:phenylalanine--tRNA ligase subunit alpha [Candidatus Babeliales bacterium]
MPELANKLSSIKREFTDALAHVQTDKQVEDIRLDFLGKKGKITALMLELKELSVDQKREFGPLLNALKQEVEAAITHTKEALANQQAQAAIQKQQHFDVTAVKPNLPQGSLHVYSQIVAEIEDIFLSMGYQVLDGPELETDDNNFTHLNIPKDHPARDMYDTFWVDVPGLLMRTHTSPVQVRAMLSHELPLAAFVPGRVYRHEAVDASHDFMFMQCEGILIDKNVNLSNLFATAQAFLKALFKKEELDIRIRPGFFPFVEPGIEIDMRCPFCSKGCSVCKKSTWMEVFPGGMIHPNVLRSCGIDPEIYSGFAFGFGLSRLAMLKYGIDDIRLFHSGKVKFLEQF